MKKIIFIFMIFPFIGISQNEFPESWVGNWKGTLEILGVDSTIQKIDMVIEIQPIFKDSVYTWVYNYIPDSSNIDRREYELHVINKPMGLYSIDEKNSIQIECFLRGNTLTSFFNVENTFIITTYTMEGDSLIFEVLAAPAKEVSTSGGKKVDGEKIPKTKTYSIIGKQKAILTRV